MRRGNALLAKYIYQGILLLKSKDKSAECIRGEFFIIVPEKEYAELMKSARGNLATTTATPEEKALIEQYVAEFQRVCNEA